MIAAHPPARCPSMAVSETCKICGARGTLRDLYRKRGFSILRCLCCGTAMTAVAEDFRAAAIYGESYFTGGQIDGYGDYPGSERVLRTEFRRTLRCLRRYCPSGRLLELGSAYGFFLSEARRDFETVGIEPCGAAVESCRRLGLEIVEGTLDQTWLGGQRPFDAAVLLDVIEHLPDPAETLAILREGLADRGILLITTGDQASCFARATGAAWRLLTPPQHLFFFTKRSLRLLLERLGFEVLHCDRPWKLVPLGLAVYQVARRLHLPLPPMAWLNRLAVSVNLFDTVRVVARKTA